LCQKLQTTSKRACLVIAGGYDTNVQENIDYYHELKQCVRQHNLSYVDEYAKDEAYDGSSVGLVVFRRSISSEEKVALMQTACSLLYTPANEHFGIVPLESMKHGTPVIAVDSGGPKETVIHGASGYLCNQDSSEFAQHMSHFVDMEAQALGDCSEMTIIGKLQRSALTKSMGQYAYVHVMQQFSFFSYLKNIHAVLNMLMWHGKLETGVNMEELNARIRTVSHELAAKTFVPFDGLSAPSTRAKSGGASTGAASTGYPQDEAFRKLMNSRVGLNPLSSKFVRKFTMSLVDILLYCVVILGVPLIIILYA